MIRSRSCLYMLLCALIACQTRPPEAIRLALLPPQTHGVVSGAAVDGTLAAEGLGALLLARLRALPGAGVQIDHAGCDSVAANTHALIIAQEDTEQSALISLRLRDCRSGIERSETLVQPRSARREWSGEAAFWVASELELPLALPNAGIAVDEEVMTRFLGAVAQLQHRTRDDVAAARITLTDIAARHPEFALGQAELATAHLLAYEYGLDQREHALRAANSAIDIALRVDPDLGLAYAARGLGLMLESRYHDATPLLARAVALDSGNASALLWMGNALLYSGRPLEAVPWLERAMAMEPTLSAARISRIEAACYSGDDQRCNEFLNDASGDERYTGSAEPSAMIGFVRNLLHAHRGNFAIAKDALDADDASINDAWVMELKADICAALLDRSCLDRTLTRMQQQFPDEPETIRALSRLSDDDVRAASEQPSTTKPEIDLWRVDLGLGMWMQTARMHDEVDRELDALQENGLRLPILDFTRACLRAQRGDRKGAKVAIEQLAAAGYQRADLWRRWQCDAR